MYYSLTLTVKDFSYTKERNFEVELSQSCSIRTADSYSYYYIFNVA